VARIRSLKPELRRDLTVATWKRDVRYTWVLLLGYLDDYGRGLDDDRLLKADLFPLDDDVTAKKLNGWLDVMAGSGDDAPLCRYEVAGQGYLHAPKWGKHQRISHPTDSLMPPCPFHDRSGDRATPCVIGSGTSADRFRNDSGAAPERLRTSRAPAEQGTGSREQGREQGLSLVSIAVDSPSVPHTEDHDGEPAKPVPPAGELASLVAAVHRRRPEWDPPGIHAAAIDALAIAGGNWPKAVAALLAVARAPSSKTPYRATVPKGFWWQELGPDWTGTAAQLIADFDRLETA
jgi:hypothetical protein